MALHTPSCSPSSVNASLCEIGPGTEVGGGADRLPLPFLAEEGGEGRQDLGTTPVSMPLGKVLWRTRIPGSGAG